MQLLATQWSSVYDIPQVAPEQYFFKLLQLQPLGSFEKTLFVLTAVCQLLTSHFGLRLSCAETVMLAHSVLLVAWTKTVCDHFEGFNPFYAVVALGEGMFENIDAAPVRINGLIIRDALGTAETLSSMRFRGQYARTDSTIQMRSPSM